MCTALTMPSISVNHTHHLNLGVWYCRYDCAIHHKYSSASPLRPRFFYANLAVVCCGRRVICHEGPARVKDVKCGATNALPIIKKCVASTIKTDEMGKEQKLPANTHVCLSTLTEKHNPRGQPSIGFHQTFAHTSSVTVHPIHLEKQLLRNRPVADLGG